MQFPRMQVVIGRKRYDTERMTVLASDVYWDGNNMERYGRNTWLARTPGGAYVRVSDSQWQGEFASLVPLSVEDAYALYEQLREHEVPVEEAFPHIEITDA